MYDSLDHYPFIVDFPNGEHETIFSREELIRLIREMMGRDVEGFVRDLHDEDRADYYRSQTDCDVYEAELESAGIVLEDVRDNLAEMLEELAKGRTRKDTLRKLVCASLIAISNHALNDKVGGIQHA